ncbi:hypothetical protein [Ramlibacter sp. AN1133]|uniref:hypothetical protein n=1 Tax=Ramlibacter sp. AN1133 TaxID=3133429 RepID=UPI0030BF00CC
MFTRIKVLAALVATLACASQAQVPGARLTMQPPPSVTMAPVPATTSAAMQRLEATGQELREAIQSLAGKVPGPERDIAIAKAQEALLKTQQAMVDLPPEYRSTAATRMHGSGYDQSVRALMAAADSLRQSVHAMAREPAGERRNQAIRDANRALLATQVAMANAYDATAFAPQTATMGAAPLQCVWLGTMWGCS